MARQTLKPGHMELELLTREELHEELTEIVSGFLRPPERIRNPAGVTLDGSGDGTVEEAYKVDAGYQLVLTRIEFYADGPGNSANDPYTAGTGGIDILVNGQWRDGVPFSSGFVLSGTYTETESKAIECRSGDVISIAVFGGPANTGFISAVCGLAAPMVSVI